MELFQTDTLQSAREKLLSCMPAIPETKTAELIQVQGQVLAEDIQSSAPIPHFRRSTVDGYAVISRDVQGASENVPAFLECIGEVQIGKNAGFSLTSGQCVYVPTGGMLPEEADAVIMVEYCETFSLQNIAVYASISTGRNVVSIGEDVAAHAVLLKKGTMLTPAAIGVLASAGISRVSVYAPLRITIISTGDELVAPDQVPAMGQVRDINTYALEALAKKRDFAVVAAHVLPDSEEVIRETVVASLQTSDLVIISGGSSQGKKDLTARIFDAVAEPGVFVHGLSMKPGKPTILAYDKKSSTALLGLPGHPAAAMIIFELIAVWVRNKWIGKCAEKYVYAKMKINMGSAPGKTTCQLVRLEDFAGEYLAEPIFGKSGIMSALAASDGYILIDMNKEGLQKGEIVKVFFM